MERRTVVVGAVGGIVASAAMGMIAMLAAATYQDSGVFTPLYHIASPVIGTDTMMETMGTTTFRAGPAFVGLAIHMMVGAAWGIVFAWLAHALHARGAGVVGLGAVFGLAVMLVMAFVGLPLTGAVLRGGDAVSDMATMVGWGTFTVEHVVFGLVLGAWYAAALRSSGAQRAPAPATA